jgi:hypothetical protein
MPTITATSTPGKSTWRRLPPNMSTRTIPLRNRAVGSQLPMCASVQAASEMTEPDGGSTPTAEDSCELAITTAAPGMKPISIGSDIR